LAFGGGGLRAVFSRADQDRITATLRELLDSGQSLGAALRELHGSRGVGLMWLVPAAVMACGLPKAEAQRVVVRETFALRHS
jgi:hypothetical protein